ncbi:hypothetical protein P12x_000107 [Tundrisphaera lichenicola]|uniref:hypothetical protein n=1 Tax=Tundrisphaera lichenicola TaxID=2029860 RepID=UPI003EB84B72
MKLPRASMTTTLFVILVGALDFGVVRDLLLNDRGKLSGYGLGFLPMANALVFGAYRLLRLGERCEMFTVGFLAAGLPVSGAFLAAIGFVPTFDEALREMIINLNASLIAISESWGQTNKVVHYAFEWLALVAFLSIPPHLVAVSGGLIAHRADHGKHRPKKRSRKRHRSRTAFAR